ncbi:MAG TPA: MFS transporter [Pirellulaceae bacterium]|nr:MFS transporter [Pirellulaceae bacterium]
MSQAGLNSAANPFQPPSGEAPTSVRNTVMVYLGVLAFLTYFDRICIARAQSVIKADLGISNTEMGLIMGAFWLAYALFELPAGWMGDKYGARVTLTRIVLAWSLFTALSGAATGFWSLLTYRFLFGVGEAGAFPNMARIQSQWLPISSRPRMGGLLWMLARWGGAFSIPIFGIMMRGFGSEGFKNFVTSIPGLAFLSEQAAWRLGFWAAGMLGVVWCIAFYSWFRDHPSEKASVNAAELELITRGAPPENKGHGMPSHLWGRLLTCKSLLAMGVLYMCGSFGWSFFASWMPRYFEEVQHMEYKESEWMAFLPLFCGGISCIVGGILCNSLVAKHGKQRWVRAVFPVSGYIVAAVSMCLIPFVKSPTQAIILMCIAESAHDFGQGANWSTIVDVGGSYAGVAAGLINTIGNMGNAFQPAIGAEIIKNYGWNTVFVVYSLAFLVAATMWSMIDPRHTFYEGHEKGAQHG